MIRPFLQLVRRDSLTKIGSLAGLGHVLVDRQVLPVHFETGNAGSSHTVGVGVVQRNGREVVQQNLLSLLVQLVGRVSGLSGSGLGAQIVERRALVIAIVGTIAISSGGSEVGHQIVFGGRIIRLPAATECALHLAIGHGGTVIVEGRVRVGGSHFGTKRVVDGVHHSGVDGLVAAVSVVGEGKLVVGSPRADGVGLLPEFLGLLLVVLQILAALEGVGIARGQRRGEVDGRSTGTVEHLVADVLTVDGHGDGLTTQGAFLGTSLEVLQAGRNGELLDDGTGLVVGLYGLIGFEGLGGGGRHGLHHVEGTGLDVGVGGVILGVDLEGHAVVLRGAVALVVRVLHEHDLVVVIPGLELVRTIADRSLTEGIRVLVEGFRQRSECGIAHLDGEHGIGLVQVDGELVIVDDLQTFELLVTLEVVGVLQRVIALDGGEEGGAPFLALAT